MLSMSTTEKHSEKASARKSIFRESPAQSTSRVQKERKKAYAAAQREIKREAVARKRELRATAAKHDKDLTDKYASARNARAKARDVYSYIGFELMFEDGTCQVEKGLWSQTISFTDISYQAAMPDDQKAYFEKWCEIFNYAGPEATIELSVINTLIPESEIGHMRFFRPGGEMNDYVQAYNNVLNQKMLEGRSNLIKNRYLTYSTAAPDYEEAVHKLAAIRTMLVSSLERLGCTTHCLDGEERLEVLSSQLRPGKDFTFSYEDLFSSGLTAKDYVCPEILDFSPDGFNDCFRTDNTWGQVLVVKNIGSRIADTALANIIDLPYPMNISLHNQQIAPGQDVAKVREVLGWIDKEIADRQMKAVQKGNDPSLLPQDVSYSKDEAEDLLDQLLYKNQHLFKFSAAIYTYADTYEQLQEQVMAIVRAGKNSALVIEPAGCQQKECLNTVLPLGLKHVEKERYLTTAQTGLMMPFATLDVFEKTGGYYGQNKESKNLIIFDRKRMSNPAGWIFGAPGSGKSFAVKREITNTRFLNPDDEIYIIDPNNEYTLLTSTLGGENFILSNTSEDHINPFDVYDGLETVTGEDPVAWKSESVTAILSDILSTQGNGLSSEERSVIDRCVRKLYAEFEESEVAPTLGDFHAILAAQKDAGRLPVALELYVTGSSSSFNFPTTVDIHNGMTCFSFKALGQNMRTFAMLVILDFVYSRVLYNFARGVTTWLYVDEAQSLFQTPGVLAYFNRFWSEGRKYWLIPTAITQNAERVLNTKTKKNGGEDDEYAAARYLFSNSDFTMMFRQAAADRAVLSSLLNLSSQQSKYIDGTCADGAGLLRLGGAKVPFEDKWPKDMLYDLWNTKPEEIAERHRAQWMKSHGQVKAK